MTITHPDNKVVVYLSVPVTGPGFDQTVDVNLRFDEHESFAIPAGRLTPEVIEAAQRRAVTRARELAAERKLSAGGDIQLGKVRYEAGTPVLVRETLGRADRDVQRAERAAWEKARPAAEKAVRAKIRQLAQTEV